MKNNYIEFSKYWAMILLGVVLFGWSGCRPVLCVSPLHSPQQNFFDPILLGAWETWDGDDRVSLEFKSMDHNRYAVTYQSGEETILFDGHGVQLGNNVFVDLYPPNQFLEDEQKKGPDSRFDMIPLHMILLYKLDHDQCQFFALDRDWVKKRMKNKFFIMQEGSQGFFAMDDIIITASTKQLQGIFLKALNKKEKIFTEIFDAPLKRALIVEKVLDR